MKHAAVYLMLKLGGNDAPTAEDVTKALDAVGALRTVPLYSFHVCAGRNYFRETHQDAQLMR